MKRKYKLATMFFIACITVLSMLTLLKNVTETQAASLKISSKAFALEAGKTKNLTVSGTKSKPKWNTSKSSVASVTSSGKVTAKAPGSATITATVSGKKLTSKVTVKAPIKLGNSSLTLETGNTKTLKVSGTTSKVKWSSSKSSVASVSSSGKVTAKSSGTATIYASVAGKKLSCKVTVKTPIKISSSSSTLEVGDTKTLKITGTSSKVSWSTSKSSIVSVSSSGKVTAKSPGTATIYASVAGKKLSSKITVRDEEKVPIKAPLKSETKVTPTADPTSDPTTVSTNTPELTTSPAPNQEQESPTVTTSQLKTKVVGYYAAWARYSGFSPDKIDASKLTHINYAFANIGSDLKVELGYPDIDQANIKQLNELKKKNPNLKTIIAVGGWSWSGRFSDAALTKESREAFADSAVDFVVKHGFDGIDIDWEYPVSGGLTTNKRRPEDKQNFTLLMQELREKLDARGKVDGKDYILSFAGAAGSWYVRNVELDKLGQIVDYANIMTYDIHGTWEPSTDFNAPLYSGSDAAGYQMKPSVDSSINSWINAGFSKSKLVMGVPFYGYVYKSVSETNNGLYQTYSGGASINYTNIVANYLNATGYTRYFHSESMVPWLFNGSTFITYEDADSMNAKANYIKNKDLGGAMIWELSQDPSRTLLNALYEGLR